MTRLMIFCDASLCHRTGAAGWAAWFRHAHWTEGKFHDAPFSAPLTNPNEAEFLALANALHIARSRGYLADVTSLYLQSDSLEALSRIAFLAPGSTRIKHTDATGRDISIRSAPFTAPERFDEAARTAFQARMEEAEWIVRTVAARFLPKVYLKHVLGHQREGASGRASINRECDCKAKRNMKHRRKVLDAAEKARISVDAETV